MSKNGSKFGRRSNWFKHKFLLEEQHQGHEQSMETFIPGPIHVNPYQTEQVPMPLSFNFNLTELANQFYLTPAQIALNQSLLEGKTIFSKKCYISTNFGYLV